MTEAQWIAGTDPKPMLEFLRGKASDRKLRLFAAACCRRIWHLLPDEGCRVALETAERFADGLASSEELIAARKAAYRAYAESVDYDESDRFRGWESAAAAVAGVCWTEGCREEGLFHVTDNCYGLGPLSTGRGNGGQIEWRRQCHSLRDIFGNPFCTTNFIPAWLTPDVVTLAQSIYTARAFDRLQELANVLQRAGCDDVMLLDHCHERKPHTRGCWIVDVILGKT
jgi:hypothetical protein